MKIIIIIFLILLISFYAIILSCPSRWVKWDEWREHIDTHHKEK